MKINNPMTITMLVMMLIIGGLTGGLLFNQKPLDVNAAPPVQKPTAEADASMNETSEISEIKVAEEQNKGRFCTATALLQYNACRNEVRDDFYTAQAICLQLEDKTERDECMQDSRSERQENNQFCLAQRRARRDLCSAVGEARYVAEFEPANFVTDFNNLPNLNPYFLLNVGNQWQYAGGDETVTVKVLDETKLIEGVTCIVVNDVVTINGQLIEDTDDWFAQAKNGDVHYCGEEVKDFETFEGDNPQIPELISIDGSFKAGRDGDQSGILIPGSPAMGQVYRQEWSPGNAEDAAQVLSTSYGFGSDATLDAFVPQVLAEQLCPANDCLVVKEFTPIEPGTFAHKYYAPGIGLFLEIAPETGELVQLTGCNFDPRCETLPVP